MAPQKLLLNADLCAVINAVNDYLYDGADAVFDVLSRTGLYEAEQLRKVCVVAGWWTLSWNAGR